MSDHDLLDPGLYEAGLEHEAYRAARARGAVVTFTSRFIAHRNAPCHAVLTHDAIDAVLRDPRHFSSSHGTRPGVTLAPRALRALHQLDPPAHTPLRARAEALFTAPDARALFAQLDARARELVDRVLADAGDDPFDAVASLAQPLAQQTLAQLLGLDDRTARELVAPIERAHSTGALLLSCAHDAPEIEARRAEAREAKRALHRAMTQALADARAGALAELCEAVDRGECTALEAQGLAVLFVEAGSLTARDALANTLSVLLEAPARAATLANATAAELARIADECVRLAPPVLQFARTVTVPTRLAGVSLSPGAQLVLFFSAACRDPRAYPRPDDFDLTRPPRQLLAYGAGPHRCIGAALARRQLVALLAALAPHAGRLRLLSRHRRRSNHLAGPTALWIAPQRSGPRDEPIGP